MTARKYRVELTESQKRRLSEVAQRGRSPVRTVKRTLALLKADEGQTDGRIAEALSISRRTVIRIRKRFCEGRIGESADRTCASWSETQAE